MRQRKEVDEGTPKEGKAKSQKECTARKREVKKKRQIKRQGDEVGDKKRCCGG